MVPILGTAAAHVSDRATVYPIWESAARLSEDRPAGRRGWPRPERPVAQRGQAGLVLVVVVAVGGDVLEPDHPGVEVVDVRRALVDQIAVPPLHTGAPAEREGP